VTVTLLRHLGIATAIAAVIAVASWRLGYFREYQMAQVAAYLVAVAGLTVLVGSSGQISVGHGAFMMIGAYTAALLLGRLGWPLALVLVLSAAVAGVAGAVVGVAAARLRGPYLAGATLMMAVALPALASRFATVLGGDQGLPVTVTTPSGLGASFPLTRWLAWVTWAAALIALVLLANLVRERPGRNWRAVRDDEVAAALAGLNVARVRVLAFVASAACAGLGGSLLAMTTSIASPGEFTLTLSVTLLAGAVLGGLGSLAGALWGSLVLVLLPTYLTDLAASHGLNGAASSNLPVAAYGAILIAVMLVFPGGIQGALRRLLGLPGSGRPGWPARGGRSPAQPAGSFAPDPPGPASAPQPPGPASVPHLPGPASAPEPDGPAGPHSPTSPSREEGTA
jgi:branched-chain amino acid transport system permease protein